MLSLLVTVRPSPQTTAPGLALTATSQESSEMRTLALRTPVPVEWGRSARLEQEPWHPLLSVPPTCSVNSDR